VEDAKNFEVGIALATLILGLDVIYNNIACKMKQLIPAIMKSNKVRAVRRFYLHFGLVAINSEYFLLGSSNFWGVGGR
jgi:hypothetical protein